MKGCPSGTCKQNKCEWWVNSSRSMNCVLRVKHEHNQSEIAKAMGISKQRVCVLERKALKKMEKGFLAAGIRG